MFALRSPLVAAAPAGLLLAMLTWLAFGREPAARDDLAALGGRLAQARPAAAHAVSGADSAAQRALAMPVFALTTGPGAVADLAVTVRGLAITPGHKAALIAVGDKPAAWLDLDATRDGVTLVAISGRGVTVDTPLGFKTVGLSDGPPPRAADAGAAATK